ncbi:hypothetical protein [Chryseobacterium aquaeductus]|nr:hypothetical protein [Chryseobacterium aquaeductus]
MKKLIIIGSIVLSGFAFAQQNSDNPYVYDEPEVTEGDVFPGNPGDPNAAPIDEYIPALLIMAIAMIVVYKKRDVISE